MAHLEHGVPSERNPRLPTLAGYAALVRSSLAVIIVTTLIGVAVGFYRATQLPQTFKASASVELPDVPTWVDTETPDPVPDRTTIDTTAQLVLSTPVFEHVAAATSMTVSQVDNQLSVSAYPLSRVLIITFETSTAELAIRGANAAARALIGQRTTVLAGAQLDAASRLYLRLATIRGHVAANLGKFSPLARKIALVLDQISNLKQDSLGYGGRVVDDAYPAKKVAHHPELQVVTGLVVGLMAGILFGWWRPSRRQTADRRVIGVE